MANGYVFRVWWIATQSSLYDGKNERALVTVVHAARMKVAEKCIVGDSRCLWRLKTAEGGRIVDDREAKENAWRGFRKQFVSVLLPVRANTYAGLWVRYSLAGFGPNAGSFSHARLRILLTKYQRKSLSQAVEQELISHAQCCSHVCRC